MLSATKIKLHTRVSLALLLVCAADMFSAGGEPSYVTYIKNKGQWDRRALYEASFKGGRAYLERDGFTYVFTQKEGLEILHPHHGGKQQGPLTLTFHTVKMKFDGASPNVQTEQQNLKPYYHNYYLGKDPKNWAGKVPLSEIVMYHDLYSGISVKTFSSNNNIRYDFIVAPQADPSQIRLKFEGQDYVSVKNEELVIATEVGEIIQQKPLAYQETGGKKIIVGCKYRLSEKNILSFEITGSYDHSKPLIIDPTLVFATFTGSTGDNWGMSASYDNQGNGYSTGICFATGYPTTTGAFQQTFNGGVTNSTYTYLGFDISVSKFDAAGSNLLFSTYLGGSDNEQPMSIIVDNNDNLLVYGRSYSANFPVTSGAYSQTLSGGSDIIIAKFNASGTALLASTFVGGSNDDGVNFSANEATLGSLKYNYADDGRGDIILDNTNNVYIATCTISNDFPVTSGCFQSSNGGLQDACVFKMDPNLSALAWSTYLGGNANDAAYSLAADNGGSIYVTGGTESPNFPVSGGALNGNYMGNIDGFLTHLSPGGNSILQSTYIGTSAYDQSYFVQLDNSSNVYIYGQTEGPYPVTAGVYSNPNSGQFIHEFDPSLATTVFSTVFGTGSGKPDLAPSAFLVDKCSNIYISGWGGTLGGYNIPNSTTNGLPVTGNAFQSNTDGMDFYFLVLQKNGTSLWYATYFGGTNGSEEHVDGGTSRFDKSGVIYQAICEGCAVNPLTNYTPNSDMPTTPNAWSSTNQSNNCNNALVKFSFDLKQTVASISLNPGNPVGCAPFTVNFGNQSINSVNYQWDFGDGTGSTLVAPSHVYTNAGTYTVQLIAIDSTTCNIYDTAYGLVQVYPPVSVAPSATLTVCSADSALLNANAINATSISWAPATGLSNPNVANPSAFTQTSITYTVTVSNGVCSASDTITVKGISGIASPQIAGGDSLSLCTYDSMKLTVTGTYTAYQWNTGQNTPSIEATHAGTYIVTTTDHFGCKGTDSVHVYEFSYAGWPLHDITICDGQAAFLQETPGNYTYHWSPASSLSNASVFNPQAHPHVTTTYTVTVQNGPCITSNTVTVHVNPLPDLHASPLKADILPGEEVQLVAISHDSVTWSPPAALSCTNCPMPVATPDDDITYLVKTGDPQTGCVDSAYVTIIVEGSFYIPNTFTPNGDYINQVFKPVCTQVYNYRMMIFDRWGNHIFTTTDTEIGWDGTFQGKPCQEDVYVYKIDYMQKHASGPLSLSGHVNLVR